MATYTGTGDKGTTSLLGGERVTKTHPRVEACGAVDELNAVLGGLLSHMTETQAALSEEVTRIQAELLQLGARLATEPCTATAEDLEAGGIGITVEHVEALESAIDRMEETLPALTGFIVPGGHPSAAWAHVARTVCRRAERRVVQVAAKVAEPDGEMPTDLRQGIVYLNRLSDYLFVLARTCNRLAGVEEVVWER
jgi:cob(I)alamin adenosyltransferase